MWQFTLYPKCLIALQASWREYRNSRPRFLVEWSARPTHLCNPPVPEWSRRDGGPHGQEVPFRALTRRREQGNDWPDKETDQQSLTPGKVCLNETRVIATA